MNTTVQELLRTAVPMAAILIIGGVLAWVFGATTAVPPLGIVGEPLAELTRPLALAVAIVYGVQRTQ